MNIVVLDVLEKMWADGGRLADLVDQDDVRSMCFQLEQLLLSILSVLEMSEYMKLCFIKYSFLQVSYLYTFFHRLDGAFCLFICFRFHFQINLSQMMLTRCGIGNDIWLQPGV